MSDQLAIFIDFENVALWAEREFFDFEITKLMEYLVTRGPAVVKRAYADWSRFSRYRDEMMINSIDLIQIYSVRTGKNRADIRMAIDAFEIALTRPQIQVFVIVSGDSDFGPLVAKLREYGRYTIGIGPRSITHELLVNSCDEFIYLETALGDAREVDEQACAEIEQARGLLSKALNAHGQRGELPILAARLKQTMLLMDPAFNEANFGYAQFKTWLEDNQDLLNLYAKDLQLYVAPIDHIVTEDHDLIRSEPSQPVGKPLVRATTPPESVETQYRQVFARLKMMAVDLATRRDVLRDIYREVIENPGQYSLDQIMELLHDRYNAQELLRNKNAIRSIFQIAYRQDAFDFGEQTPSIQVPAWIASGIATEAEFVGRAEADFIYAVIRSGIKVDLNELAYLLVNDRNQGDYIQQLIDDLEGRGLIVRKDGHYALPGLGMAYFKEDPLLKVLYRDIQEIELPNNLAPGVETAQNLARRALVQRSQDFAASTETYLIACKLQWDSVEEGEPGADLEDLRWYLASYASAMAGKLSQVNRDYGGARPYYLAFFALVQEDDPLWSRMRGLINPMLSYYWSNAARELDINISSWNPIMSSPAQIAVQTALHPKHDLRRLFHHLTLELARVNPGLLRRIANQLMLSRTENPDYDTVAEQIQGIIEESQVS